MKTSLKQLKQILRGIAFTAALASTTVGIHTQTADAEVRNSCRDYFTQLAQMNLQQANVWTDFADALNELPDGLGGLSPWSFDMVADARMQARIHVRAAESYYNLSMEECSN